MTDETKPQDSAAMSTASTGSGKELDEDGNTFDQIQQKIDKSMMEDYLDGHLSDKP